MAKAFQVIIKSLTVVNQWRRLADVLETPDDIIADIEIQATSVPTSEEEKCLKVNKKS